MSRSYSLVCFSVWQSLSFTHGQHYLKDYVVGDYTHLWLGLELWLALVHFVWHIPLSGTHRLKVDERIYFWLLETTLHCEWLLAKYIIPSGHAFFWAHTGIDSQSGNSTTSLYNCRQVGTFWCMFLWKDAAVVGTWTILIWGILNRTLLQQLRIILLIHMCNDC